MRYRANRLEAEDLDLGFGSVVADESRRRLLNRDGSFNVVRHGLGWRGALSLYHSLLTLSWPSFLLLVLAAYLATHVVFAVLYTLCGPDALTGVPATTGREQALRAFFFSVHTLSTIGYGQIVPASLGANLLMTVESMAGLFGLALVTGLVFARFSRPTADIVFSRQAVVAPYRGITAFEFRIANQRRNQLVELEAKVLFARLKGEPGNRKRHFYDLDLERRKVTFFPIELDTRPPDRRRQPAPRPRPRRPGCQRGRVPRHADRNRRDLLADRPRSQLLQAGRGRLAGAFRQDLPANRQARAAGHRRAPDPLAAAGGVERVSSAATL